MCDLINCTKTTGPNPQVICCKPFAPVSVGKLKEPLLAIISGLRIIPWHMSWTKIPPHNVTSPRTLITASISKRQQGARRDLVH